MAVGLVLVGMAQGRRVGAVGLVLAVVAVVGFDGLTA